MNKSVNLLPLRFRQNVMLGCDPEFFFTKNGKVIGSEKVLPKDGLKAADGYDSKTIIDGVQAELNPDPSTCRESLAWGIFSCFNRLVPKINKTGISVQADAVVSISQEELDSLSEGSRQFGCAPSTNIYNEGADKTSKITANPTKYLKRSAGGHIHLGNGYIAYINDRDGDTRDSAIATEKALKQMPDVMVPMLDIIVGNTCVLLDRNEGNVERRKNYGRVGEYRLKSYGIEYRTLSNFWLRSYPLFSFVFGIARMAVHLVEQSTPDSDYVKAIFDAVSREDIVEAVQKNDFDLAMKNFKKIEPIITNITGSGNWPINADRLSYFYHFVNLIVEKGLEYWFPTDAFTHWSTINKQGGGSVYRNQGGWERFAENVIASDLYKKHQIDLSTKQSVSVA